MFRFAVVLLLLITGSAAQAQTRDYRSGNYYLPLCKLVIAESFSANADFTGRGRCMGIILVLIETGEEYVPASRFCVPNGVSVAQATRVVINYIEANAQSMHLDFILLAQLALRQAWPCR